MQNPFADVTENPTVREQVGSNARWHGFMLPRHRASSTQSSGSVSFTHNRSKDSLPAEYGAPAPPPPAQRPSSRASRSSHRVPVPYAGVGAHGDDMRQVESWQTTGGPSEHLLTQIVQNDPPPPPRLPPRSPLRSLATNDVAKALQESALNLSLSRASTPSIYPPSIHHPDADVDADPIYQKEIVATLPSSSDKREVPVWLTRGLSYRTKSVQGQRVDRLDGSAGHRRTRISPVDSDGTPSLTASASSSSHAHYSPSSPTSDLGTSVQDGGAHNRKVAPPQIPPTAAFSHQFGNRNSGVRPRQVS